MDQAESYPEGAKVEATVPLGRKPLLSWLFERGNSTETGNK